MRMKGRLAGVAGVIAMLAFGWLLALLAAPAASASPVDDAISKLQSDNLYIGDPAAKLDEPAVRSALPSDVKIAILPANSGDATTLAKQIGEALDPSGQRLVVGVVAGRHFSAAA